VPLPSIKSLKKSFGSIFLSYFELINFNLLARLVNERWFPLTPAKFLNVFEIQTPVISPGKTQSSYA
jgi:hypothetical protein